MRNLIYSSLFLLILFVSSAFYIQIKGMKNSINELLISKQIFDQNQNIQSKLLTKNQFDSNDLEIKQILQNEIINIKQKLKDEIILKNKLENDLIVTNNKLKSLDEIKKNLNFKLLIIKIFVFFIDSFIMTLIFICIHKNTEYELLLFFSIISSILMTFLILLNYHSNIINTIYSTIIILTIVINFGVFGDCNNNEMNMMSRYLIFSGIFKYFLFIENSQYFYQHLIIFTLFGIEMLALSIIESNHNLHLIFIFCSQILLFLFVINGQDSSFIVSNSGCITILFLLLLQIFEFNYDIQMKNVSLFLFFLSLGEYILVAFTKPDLQYCCFISIILMIEIIFLIIFNSKYNNDLFICEKIFYLICIYTYYYYFLICIAIFTSILIHLVYYFSCHQNEKKIAFILSLSAMTSIINIGFLINKKS